MPTRDAAPLGAPCWTDLWTSDVDGSRAFYSELFGWEAQEPSEEFGGYFMFTRHGIPTAGGMGDMGDQKADNAWKIYFNTNDIERTASVATANGATVASPPMAVADLGKQMVLSDPSGAALGAWEPGTFPGFSTLNEHGAPSWFELHTREFAQAVAFYPTVFGLEAHSVGDTDEFRYTVLFGQGVGDEIAGIMDASGFLPEGAPPAWSVYWQVDDVDVASAKVVELGGSIIDAAQDTPYGRIASVADPSGATFRLRRPPVAPTEG